MAEKKVKVASTKCDGCGDDMVFSPDDACLKCPSCNSLKAIQTRKLYAKHSVVEDKNLADDNKSYKEANRFISCPNCGAKITLKGLTVSSVCPYCSTGLVSIKDEGEGKSPDAVIPFRVSKQKAEEIFRKRLTKNWLVPSSFKKNISTDSIEAFYFPSFVFNASCQSSYSGEAYDTYTDSDGDSHRRYYPVFGKLKSEHKGIEVESSSKLSQEELNLVRPYYITEAVNYQSQFIAGYSLECYDQSVKNCYGQAQEVIKNDIRNQIVRKINADGIVRLNINTAFMNPTYSYCVLPIYRINYQHKDKKYSNVINGQTGALGGKIPKSGFKLSMVIILPILAVLLPILLVTLL